MSKETTQSVIDLEAQIVEQKQQIAELKKQVEKPSYAETKVSVADMNQMYSNHLMTIDLILAVVSFVIIVGGGFFGWLGFRTIRNMIDQKLDDQIDKVTQEITEKAIKPVLAEHKKLEAKYKEVIEHQTKQDAELKRQDEEFSKKLKVEHFFSEGARFFQDEKYKKCIESLTKAVELDPENPYVLTNRAVAKSKIKSYRDALNDIDKAIKLRPDLANSWYNKACFLALSAENDDETLSTLKKTIDLDDSFKAMAQDDEDFASIRDNPEFRKLVGLE